MGDQSGPEIKASEDNTCKYDLRARHPTNSKSKKQVEHITTSTSESTVEDPSHQFVLAEVPVIDMEHFAQANTDDRLVLLMSAINKINTNFHYKFDAWKKQMTDDVQGVFPRLTSLESTNEEILARVDDVEKEVASNTEAWKTTAQQQEKFESAMSKIPEEHTQLKSKIEKLETLMSNMCDELSVVKGFVQTQDKALKTTKEKVVDLTARSMSNNITISGILGDLPKEENCKAKVLDFMRTEMAMEVSDEEVLVAHRMGKYDVKNVKPRLIVVRCSQQLIDRVFQYTSNLKGKMNAKKDYYFVRKQLPEPLLTQKIEREEVLRTIRKNNDALTKDEEHLKVKAFIRDKTLFINEKPQKKHIFPPTAQEIFNISKPEQQKLDCLTVVHTKETTDKENIFQGHAAKVSSNAEIKLCYKKLKQLFPDRDHIMMGYSFKNFHGHHDDDEHGAGKRISKILNDRQSKNTVVFVSRLFSGVHIGQRRFLHIEEASRQALNLLQNQQ